jgi:hypothetical protein
MEVKVIKDINIQNGPIIPKGEICKVRVLVTQFMEFNAPFQVIEGKYSGHMIPRKYAVEHSNEKMFTTDQVKSIENYYKALLDKERAAKDRAIEMVATLGQQIVKKNAEIEKLEFCVSALSIGLSASSEAIAILRETAKQNG